MWNDVDSEMQLRVDFPLHRAAGTEASAVVYFEIEPGKNLALHRDGAEELLLVLEGTGVAMVDGEEIEVEPGSLALVPRLAPHAVRNAGTTTLKVVGFFAAAELDSIVEHPLRPFGTARPVDPARGGSGLTGYAGRPTTSSLTITRPSRSSERTAS